MPEPLLTVEQAATALGCARSHAYRLVRIGALPSVSLGRAIRIAPSALADFIERGGAQRIVVDTRPRRAGGRRAPR